MKPRTARRTLLVSLVLLSGCAAFPPEPTLTVAAGSSICTAPTLAECERLSKIGESLHSPAMERAIAGARR